MVDGVLKLETWENSTYAGPRHGFIEANPAAAAAL
jgi:hypothetical protein